MQLAYFDGLPNHDSKANRCWTSGYLSERFLCRWTRCSAKMLSQDAQPRCSAKILNRDGQPTLFTNVLSHGKIW
jgi:hypothetical protein